LKILHVTPFAARAWAYGGIPRVVGELARGLAARGHDVTVCATDACDGERRLTEVPPNGVSEKLFRNLSNQAAYRWQLFLPLGLSSWLRERAGDFDVAHLHACRNLPGTLAARHLRRAGVPIVLQPHGTARRFERRQFAKWIFDQTLGRHALDADRVLAVSGVERADLAALGLPSARLAVLGNPVDDTVTPPPGAFRARHHIPWREMVLFLGKLTPGKRVELLIDAFAQLNRPDAGLVIAGNDMGSGPSLRRQVARLGLEARTRFVGLLAGRERFEALVDASVLAYPSHPEAFGLVPMEALQCGTPVVVSDESGCGKLIDEIGGGRLMCGADPRSLADAIRSVLDDRPACATAAATAGAEVRARFSRDRICADLERHYTEVVARRS
jgi:glycosyltransferase involved in cell wall biosynthesis